MTTDGSADWTLITVTYNSAAQLRQSWAPAATGNARWIVVDNASTDDSVEVARSLGAQVIALPENRGFAAANNVALAGATTRYVGFLNPDLTVRAASDLDRLAAVSAANDGALVAPQLVNPDGSEQPNARGLPYLSDKFAHRGLSVPGSRLEDYVRVALPTPTFVAWAIGAALGGPTEVFRKIGGWDERFLVYYEDHEIGLRAWQAGVPVVVDPKVHWTHAWQRATTRPSLKPWKHEIRSASIFYRDHSSLLLGRRRRTTSLGPLAHRLWKPAADPCQGDGHGECVSMPSSATRV